MRKTIIVKSSKDIDAESSALNVKATVKRILVTLAITTQMLIVTKRIMYSYRQLKVQRYQLCMKGKCECIMLVRRVSQKTALSHVQGRVERIITLKNVKGKKSAMLRLILRFNMQLKSFNPTRLKFTTNGYVKVIGTHLIGIHPLMVSSLWKL
jgi:hypothetical protein